MDELDKKIKNIWKKGKPHGTDRKSDTCPDDAMLAQYTDGVLKESDKDIVEKHFLECSDCLDMVLLHKQVRDDIAFEQSPEAPRAWMEKAKSLHAGSLKEEKPGLFDIILGFAKETIEIIQNPGNLDISYGGVPVPVRGEGKGTASNIVTLSKTLYDLKAEVEIERTQGDLVNVKILLKEAGDQVPGPGLRVSLLDPDREVASLVARHGEVYFEHLKEGKYSVKVTRQGHEVGHISFIING